MGDLRDVPVPDMVCVRDPLLSGWVLTECCLMPYHMACMKAVDESGPCQLCHLSDEWDSRYLLSHQETVLAKDGTGQCCFRLTGIACSRVLRDQRASARNVRSVRSVLRRVVLSPQLSVTVPE